VKEVGKHISDLLFDHDCVIVPSLGGFLASNQPSRVLLPNHIIYPPYRKIAFNVYLRQNDGLLANHISETESIPYPEAARLIDSFTSGCFDILDTGKKVEIQNVGNLFYDKEKNLQFEVSRNVNHLKDSFGMEAVHFLPIKRDVKTEKPKSSEEKTIRASVPPIKKIVPATGTGNKRKYIGIAAVVSALVWLSLNLYYIAPKKYEATSLSPFDSQETAYPITDSFNSVSVEENSNDPYTEVETINTITPDNSVIADEDNTVREEESEVAVTKPEIKEIVVPPASIALAKVTSENKNHLVAGVFKIRENADKMHQHLLTLGFSNAAIIVANNKSYVTYESFQQQADAKSFADSIRKQNLEGWVWVH
jgi:hypothetical protein